MVNHATKHCWFQKPESISTCSVNIQGISLQISPAWGRLYPTKTQNSLTQSRKKLIQNLI